MTSEQTQSTDEMELKVLKKLVKLVFSKTNDESSHAAKDVIYIIVFWSDIRKRCQNVRIVVIYTTVL